MLVVEDESLVLMLAEDVLADAGASVVVAMQLAQALEMARTAHLDCAILDVNLGEGETSYSVADALQERSIPFIFVTGYGKDGLDGDWSGHRVVQKPYDPVILLSALASALG